MRCALLILAFVWLHGGAAFAQPTVSLDAETSAAVDRAVEAELAKQKLVGVAIGILRDGRIVYLQGYGQANRERNTPVTTETVFNWASNSKPVVAVAAMQLVEKKQLDLDADVRTYVPEFPQQPAVITTRHLLTHQSGIPHYANGKVVGTPRTDSAPHSDLDPLVSLDRFNRSPLLFQPGEKTSYSSYAYILLSAVVQRAGKEDFSKQVEHRIVQPLGMKSFQLDMESADQLHWSQGYTRTKAGEIVPAKEEAHYWKHGAGGFKSNVGDFARWAEGLLAGKLLSTATQQQMWTRQPLSNGESTTWGLGFALEELEPFKVSHNGGQREVATRMVLYPNARHGVVVMCNCDHANPAAISTAVYAGLNGRQR